MRTCPRCGSELTRDNIYGYCEPCLWDIVADYEARLGEPLDLEVVQEGQS